MGEEDIVLQGYSGDITSAEDQRFVLLIGTCEDLQGYTNNTDCEPNSYVKENLKFVKLRNNYFTEFYSS
jgi:hypothetical protein